MLLRIIATLFFYSFFIATSSAGYGKCAACPTIAAGFYILLIANFCWYNFIEKSWRCWNGI
jgi:hypothetical protein